MTLRSEQQQVSETACSHASTCVRPSVNARTPQRTPVFVVAQVPMRVSTGGGRSPEVSNIRVLTCECSELLTERKSANDYAGNMIRELWLQNRQCETYLVILRIGDSRAVKVQPLAFETQAMTSQFASMQNTVHRRPHVRQLRVCRPWTVDFHGIVSTGFPFCLNVGSVHAWMWDLLPHPVLVLGLPASYFPRTKKVSREKKMAYTLCMFCIIQYMYVELFQLSWKRLGCHCCPKGLQIKTSPANIAKKELFTFNSFVFLFHWQCSSLYVSSYWAIWR